MLEQLEFLSKLKDQLDDFESTSRGAQKHDSMFSNILFLTQFDGMIYMYMPFSKQKLVGSAHIRKDSENVIAEDSGDLSSFSQTFLELLKLNNLNLLPSPSPSLTHSVGAEMMTGPKLSKTFSFLSHSPKSMIGSPNDRERKEDFDFKDEMPNMVRFQEVKPFISCFSSKASEDSLQLPTLEVKFVNALLSTLNNQNVLNLMSALLSECRILVFCQNVPKAIAIFHAIVGLLHPFSWQHM